MISSPLSEEDLARTEYAGESYAIGDVSPTPNFEIGGSNVIQPHITIETVTSRIVGAFTAQFDNVAEGNPRPIRSFREASGINCLLRYHSIKHFYGLVHLLPKLATVGVKLEPSCGQIETFVAIGNCNRWLDIPWDREGTSFTKNLLESRNLCKPDLLNKCGIDAQNARLMLGLEKALGPFTSDLVHCVDEKDLAFAAMRLTVRQITTHASIGEL